MPEYYFTDGTGAVYPIRATMGEIGVLTEHLEHLGWRRLFTPPHIQVVPGYWDARALMEQEGAAEDRQRAEEKVKAIQDLAQAVRPVAADLAPGESVEV